MTHVRCFIWFVAGTLLSATGATAQPVTSPAAPQRPDAAAAAFPGDARIGFVNLEHIATVSAAGKALTARMQDLRTKKAAEAGERNKQVDALQAKLSQAGSVLSDAAREQLRRDVERARVDTQRFVQDAQAEISHLQEELQDAFAAKLFPIVGQVATEKGLWAVFSVGESGLVWSNPALDLSDEVASRMDGTPDGSR